MINYEVKIGSISIPLDDYRESADIQTRRSSVEFLIAADGLVNSGTTYEDFLDVVMSQAPEVSLVNSRSGGIVFEYPGYRMAEAGRRVDFSTGEFSIFLRLERVM